METIRLLPDLFLLRFPVGQAYLWRDAGELTLIDSGPPGSAPAIARGLRGLGHRTADLRRIVLTHAHPDHAGSAAEVAGWHGAPVLAGRLDAPVIRGERPVPPPVLTDLDRDLFERVHGAGEATADHGRPRVPATPPAPVDRELDDGDAIDEVAGGATVLAVPGHTAGSIALYLPGPGVLFAGDTVARAPDGTVMPGVFNVDGTGTAAALRRLAGLEATTACVGHGDPVVGGAAAALRAAAAALTD